MSKMGNAIIRAAEGSTLDQALRAGEAEFERSLLATEFDQLRAEVAGLAATAARLAQQVAGARAVLATIGMVPLIDAASYLGGHDRPAMARAVDEAADAIRQARAILDGA